MKSDFTTKVWNIFKNISTLFSILIILFVAFKAYPILKTLDFSKDKNVIYITSLIIYSSFGIAFGLFLIILVIGFAQTIIKWVKSSLLTNFNERAENILKKADVLEGRIDKFERHNNLLSKNMYKLERIVENTTKQLEKSRKIIKDTLKQLEKDLNIVFDQFFHHLKNSFPEMLALFQVTISNYLLEFSNPETKERFLNWLFSAAVFIVAVQLKNPKLKFYQNFILLTFLEAPILTCGYILNKNNLHFQNSYQYAYYWLSIFIYIMLIRKAYKNKELVNDRVNIATDEI